VGCGLWVVGLVRALGLGHHSAVGNEYDEYDTRVGVVRGVQVDGGGGLSLASTLTSMI
jgi:hypothetical protein